MQKEEKPGTAGKYTRTTVKKEVEMLSRYFAITTLLSALFAIGCGAPYATMNKSGLEYRDYRVSVTSISEYKPRFLEGNWEIENWLERATDKTWRRKDVAPFKGNVYIDRYSTGDPRKVKKYYSELVLDHDGSLSTLTVDVTSASSRDWDTKIEDMYKTFVDNLAAKEPWYAGKRFEKATVSKQAKITLQNFKAFKVQGFDALIGYVDRSEFDSNEANADMRYGIFMLKLTDAGGKDRTLSIQGTKEKIPVIVMVVLEAEPDYFNSLENDFYDLIRLIRVNGKEINVEYVNSSAPPPESESCDEDAAEKDGKKCSKIEMRDIGTEDIIDDPMGGAKKKNREAPQKRDADPSGLF